MLSRKRFCIYASEKQSSSKFVNPEGKFVKWNDPEKLNLFSNFKLPQETLVKIRINNYIKKLTVGFVNENYFLYDKSNVIEQTFITEKMKKLIYIYDSISYYKVQMK